jgi:hypothetical protein
MANIQAAGYVSTGRFVFCMVEHQVQPRDCWPLGNQADLWRTEADLWVYQCEEDRGRGDSK